MTREEAEKLVARFEWCIDTLCEGHGKTFDEAMKDIDRIRRKLVRELIK